MIEVPSLLFALDDILPRVDFLSVGSNDLVQFLFAADRSNARVAGRFDPISAPVMRALKQILEKGRAHNKPIALCGELASRPLEALALIAAGFRTLSLSPAAIGPVKAMILELDVGQAAPGLAPLLTHTSRNASTPPPLPPLPASAVQVRRPIRAMTEACSRWQGGKVEPGSVSEGGGGRCKEVLAAERGTRGCSKLQHPPGRDREQRVPVAAPSGRLTAAARAEA